LYLDASGDGLLSPVDALCVVNYLNQSAHAMAAEGESTTDILERSGSEASSPIVVVESLTDSGGSQVASTLDSSRLEADRLAPREGQSPAVSASRDRPSSDGVQGTPSNPMWPVTLDRLFEEDEQVEDVLGSFRLGKTIVDELAADQVLRLARTS
jgi:hypothetical protein